MVAVLEFAGEQALPLMDTLVEELMDLVDRVSVGFVDGRAQGGWAAPQERSPLLVPCAKALRALARACAEPIANATVDETAVRVETPPLPQEAAEAEAAADVKAADVKAADVKAADVKAADVKAAADADSADEDGEDDLSQGFDELIGILEGLVDIAKPPPPPPPPPPLETDADEQEAEEYEGGTGDAYAELQDEAEAKPPMEVTLALRVVSKIEDLLLSWPTAGAQVLLEAISLSLPLLAPWPRLLLPKLHYLWQPLFVLCSSSELSLAARACGLVGELATTLRGELSTHTMRAVLPPLLNVLERHGRPPDRLPQASGAAQLAPRQRPREVLLAATGALGALCHVPRAVLPDLPKIANLCEPLLSIRQPEDVRAAAVHLFKRLARLNTDVVWLFTARAGHIEKHPLTHKLPSFEGLPALPGPREDFALSSSELVQVVQEEDRRVVTRAFKSALIGTSELRAERHGFITTAPL
tara:strand:- start:987 stop:2405 length:1419 start_codon:yes stop_codon:yes gene_type:complete